jgi:hypothetical protein
MPRTPLTLLDREKSSGRTEWIVGRSPYFLSHHATGDELWLSHRPYGINQRIHTFQPGQVPTLEDVDEALDNLILEGLDS